MAKCPKCGYDPDRNIEMEKAIALQKYLEKKGFLAIAIRPPTVPEGESRIRITIRRNIDINALKNFTAVLKDFK